MAHFEENNPTNKHLKSFVIEYGPIRVRCRRRTAPTLATGRQSKHAVLNSDAAIVRELRRAKNRVAARKLKERRESIQKHLLEQIKELEDEQCRLRIQFDILASYREQLNERLNEIQQDPLNSLISDPQLVLFFEQYDHSNIDLTSFLTDMDHCSFDTLPLMEL